MNIKKTILYLIISLAFVVFFIAPNEASAFKISFSSLIGEGDFANFLEGILGKLQGIIAFLAVLFIVIGGVLYLIAPANEGMVKAAKLCWTGALIGIALAAAGPSFLQEIKKIVIPNGFCTELDCALTLKEIVMNTLSFLLSIIGMLAIIGLTIGGIMLTTTYADSKQAETAKSAVKYSIIGIALAGASLVLVKQITTLITG